MGHVSIIMAFYPHHISLLLLSVVGPGGPLRKSHTVTGLLQNRKLAKTKGEKMIKHTRKKTACIYT
jgi:hypothetical protein